MPVQRKGLAGCRKTPRFGVHDKAASEGERLLTHLRRRRHPYRHHRLPPELRRAHPRCGHLYGPPALRLPPCPPLVPQPVREQQHGPRRVLRALRAAEAAAHRHALPAAAAAAREGGVEQGGRDGRAERVLPVLKHVGLPVHGDNWQLRRVVVARHLRVQRKQLREERPAPPLERQRRDAVKAVSQLHGEDDVVDAEGERLRDKPLHVRHAEVLDRHHQPRRLRDAPSVRPAERHRPESQRLRVLRRRCRHHLRDLRQPVRLGAALAAAAACRRRWPVVAEKLDVRRPEPLLAQLRHVGGAPAAPAAGRAAAALRRLVAPPRAERDEAGLGGAEFLRLAGAAGVRGVGGELRHGGRGVPLDDEVGHLGNRHGAALLARRGSEGAEEGGDLRRGQVLAVRQHVLLEQANVQHPGVVGVEGLHGHADLVRGEGALPQLEVHLLEQRVVDDAVGVPRHLLHLVLHRRQPQLAQRLQEKRFVHVRSATAARGAGGGVLIEGRTQACLLFFVHRANESCNEVQIL
eukprot:Rhum_TRINITY_DN14647_c13_g1::Rhum_TRINITY_DN14647_c13_g1_i1::g.107102::m.107102